jgi:hypothetical protein
MRASLGATAATTTLNGRRCRRPWIHDQSRLAVRPALRQTSARAPRTIGDQLAAQIAIAAFAQAEMAHLAAGAVLGGHAAEPGGEMAARVESGCVGHGRGERGGNDRADTRNFAQGAADRVRAGQRHQPAVELGDLVREIPQVRGEGLQHRPAERWDTIVLDLAEQGKQLPYAGPTPCRDDAERREMAA